MLQQKKGAPLQAPPQELCHAHVENHSTDSEPVKGQNSFAKLCAEQVAEFPHKTQAEHCHTIEIKYHISMASPERRAVLQRAIKASASVEDAPAGYAEDHEVDDTDADLAVYDYDEEPDETAPASGDGELHASPEVGDDEDHDTDDHLTVVPRTATVDAPADTAAAKSFEVTGFRTAQGWITKRVELDGEGNLKIDGAPTLWRGNAWRVRYGSLADFAEALTRCPSNEAFGLGQLIDGLEDEVDVVTIQRLNGGGSASRISRSAEFFHFRPGRGVIAIDSDTKGQPDDVRARVEAAGGVWGALVKAVPELEGVGRVLRASTTAGSAQQASRSPAAAANTSMCWWRTSPTPSAS